MSLINDVLRDVERRRGDEFRSRPSTTGSRRSRLRVGLVWWVAAAALAGIALHWLLAGQSDREYAGETLLVASLDPANDRTESESPAAAPIEVPEAAGEKQATDPPPEQTGATDQGPEAEGAPNAPGEAAPEPDEAPAKSARDPGTPSPAAGSSAVAESRLAVEQSSRSTSSIQDDRPQTQDSGISIRRAGSGSSDGADSQLASARRALARDQFSLAERRIRDLLEAHPGHDEARRVLAEALMRRGHPGQAAALLEAGLDHSREPAGLAQQLGRLYLESGQTRRAIETLRPHAPEPVDNPDYHQLLAAAHRQAGDHEAALASYQALSEVVPGRSAVWIGMGASLESLERPQEAIAAYERVAGNDRAARFARQRIDALERAHGGP